MISRIIDFSARNRLIVLALVAVAAIYGWWSMNNVALDAIPDLSDTQVIIYSRWDRSPDVIEDQVAYPIVTALLGAFIRSEMARLHATRTVIYKRIMRGLYPLVIHRINPRKVLVAPSGVEVPKQDRSFMARQIANAPHTHCPCGRPACGFSCGEYVCARCQKIEAQQQARELNRRERARIGLTEYRCTAAGFKGF